MADPVRPISLVRAAASKDRSSVKVINGHPARLADLYYHLVTAPWLALIGLFAAAFLLLNLVFGTAYWLAGGVMNARPGSFTDAFFFSVQTLATIGYGYMAPAQVQAHVIVTVESMAGILLTAVATGLTFAKFSLPKGRVMFSDKAVISDRDGVPTLMFRVANERSTHVMEATMRVALLRSERTREGEQIRKLHDLQLARSTSPAFVLTWTAIHVIDESSPLHGCTPESLRQNAAEIIVTLSGLDTGLSQQINARHSYLPEEIVFGHRFVDLISMRPDGGRVIDYGKFHDVVPLAQAPKVGGGPG